MFGEFIRPIADGKKNIKTIQSGVASYYNNTSMNVAISEINTLNSVVLVSVPGLTTTANYISIAARITSSTNVLLTSNSSVASYIYVYWTVIEFYNVKSLQTGTYSWATSSNIAQTVKQVTISRVNANKVLAFASMTTSRVDSYYTDVSLAARVSAPETLDLIRKDYLATVYWQVIEFY